MSLNYLERWAELLDLPTRAAAPVRGLQLFCWEAMTHEVGEGERLGGAPHSVSRDTKKDEIASHCSSKLCKMHQLSRMLFKPFDTYNLTIKHHGDADSSTYGLTRPARREPVRKGN
jgi:hypothetical protein